MGSQWIKWGDQLRRFQSAKIRMRPNEILQALFLTSYKLYLGIRGRRVELFLCSFAYAWELSI
jgi:hypothetical protein